MPLVGGLPSPPMAIFYLGPTVRVTSLLNGERVTQGSDAKR